MAVADALPREPRHVAQRAASEEVSGAGAAQAPGGVVDAVRIDQHPDAGQAPDGVAPLGGGRRPRVTDRHPVELGMLGGSLAQRAGGELGERAAGVAEEGHDRRLTLEEPRLGELPCRLAELRGRGGGER